MPILHFAEHMIHLARDDVRHVGSVGPGLEETVKLADLLGAGSGVGVGRKDVSQVVGKARGFPEVSDPPAALHVG